MNECEMTIEEIKRNAPSGATGYILKEDQVKYVKFDSGHWSVAVDPHNGEQDLYWGWLVPSFINKIKPL